MINLPAKIKIETLIIFFQWKWHSGTILFRSKRQLLSISQAPPKLLIYLKHTTKNELSKLGSSVGLESKLYGLEILPDAASVMPID